jgi:hypothetical protein
MLGLGGLPTITLGFAGNDSPSFVFPTAIATKSAAGGSGGSGSGRPSVANKPSYLTGGAGPGGHLSMKRGTEDLDFFIGDEALAAANGPGMSYKVYLRNLLTIQVMAYITPSAMDRLRTGYVLQNQTRGLGWRLTILRITWRDSGRIPYSNTYVSNQKITTFC